jgi:sulfonate transport system substrate-binding protein
VSKPRLLFVPFAIAILALAVAACGGGSSSSSSSSTSAAADSGSADGVTLKVGQNAENTSPSFIASGEDKPPNYNIEWVNFEAAPEAITALTSGSIDIAAASSVGALAAQAAGAEVEAIAASYQSPSQYQIMVPKGSPIKTIADLKGKKIAVLRASAGEGFLIAALKKGGLSEHDVTLTNLQPPDALSDFGKGDFDAWAIWEPYVSEAELELEAEPLAEAEGAWKPLLFELTTPSVLEDPAKAAAVADFAKRYAKATEWVRENVPAYVKQYASATELPENIAEHAAPNGLLTAQSLDSVAKDYEENANMFYEGGLLESEPSDTGALFESSSEG